MTTQNLFRITHRESNLLRRPFQRQSITVPGTQTSVSFLQKLPGVAQTSLFASASAPLAPPHLTSAFRRPCQSRGRPCAQRHQPPHSIHLIYACVNFSARKSRCSRRARVRNFARVAISRRCRSEGFCIINRTCLARVHRRSSPDGESGKTNTSTIVSARSRTRGGDDRLMLLEILDS